MTGRVYIGAISGTSVDGLDLAALRVDAQIEFLAAETVALPADLRQNILALIQGNAPDEVELLGRTDARLGTFIGEAINTFIASSGLSSEDIAAVGSHGQTVRHRPDGPDAFTLQIGSGSRIAEITGLTTVDQLRLRDIAAGGQGAPLVPPFHQALFSHSAEARVAVNIGGIANVSRIAPGEPLSGWDTGPGNALMDAWIAETKGVAYDDGGAFAQSGQVDPRLLQALLEDPYLAEAAPKSTGKEHYNLPWLKQRLKPFSLPPEGVQATLCRFTAQTIADQIGQFARTDRVIVCGGGRLNAVLMSDLGDIMKCPVETSEAHGVDGDAIEAAAFAWLASRTLLGLAGNEPAVTGAAGLRILGAVHGQI